MIPETDLYSDQKAKPYLFVLISLAVIRIGLIVRMRTVQKDTDQKAGYADLQLRFLLFAWAYSPTSLVLGNLKDRL